MDAEGDLLAQQPLPAQQNRRAPVVGQEAVVIAAAPPQPAASRLQVTQGSRQVDLVRGEGRAVCRRLQNAVGAGEELLQVADGPQLHDAIRHTQRDAQHLAVCQSLLQDGTGVDLPPGGDEAEHRFGTAILRKSQEMAGDGPFAASR